MTTEVDPLDSLPSGVKLLLRHLHALIPQKNIRHKLPYMENHRSYSP